jgi:hypothetical protein
MHNRIVAGLLELFRRLFVTVRLTSSVTLVEKEPESIIGSAPRLRPFDLAVLFDHLLDETAWHSNLTKLGFDVTMISSNHPTQPVQRLLVKMN